MSPNLPFSADDLIDRIRLNIRQAADTPALDARHERFYLVVRALKSEILEFASEKSDDDAVLRCIRALHEESAAFKRAHAIAWLPYSPEIDQRYPFRNEAGNPVHVMALQPEGQPAEGTHTYSADQVWPYLEIATDPVARGALYHNKLLCRAMLSTDLRDARESALVGERGVFAARGIARGECLGVYGGRLMTPATFYTCLDDAFVLSTTADGIESWIDGENILAMANTVFAYEGDQPACQAASGYNMEAAIFQATSRCGRRFSLRAFFTIEPVAAGTELRWNYRYPPALIRQRFGA